MPQIPADQRSWSTLAPTPSGVTAPIPVTTTSTTSSGALRHEVDRVADGRDLGDVRAAQLDAELLLDDLRELGEVKRVDVERGQLGVAVDVRGVRAEADQRVRDDLLD